MIRFEPIKCNWRLTLKKGWYAIHWGFDPQEGSFIEAAYYDGNTFDSDLPVIQASSEPFNEESKALEWAEANDISS